MITIRSIPAPEIIDFGPKSVKAGETFSVHDGKSAMWLRTLNASPETTMIMNQVQLETSFGGPRSMSALVPEAVVEQAGYYEFYLLDRNTHKKSETRVFVVECVVDEGAEELVESASQA